MYFCDEFHFGIGPQVTKRVKRPIGKKWRYWKHNVHRKKMTAKDTKAKAREPDHLPLLNIFVVVGPDYRRFIPYDIGSPNGKMTTKVYLELLKQLKPDLDGIIFYQDKDSVYSSKAVAKWAKEEGIDLLTLPGKSPDFSIMEQRLSILIALAGIQV
jgi:hypothetical protein